MTMDWSKSMNFKMSRFKQLTVFKEKLFKNVSTSLLQVIIKNSNNNLKNPL